MREGVRHQFSLLCRRAIVDSLQENLLSMVDNITDLEVVVRPTVNEEDVAVSSNFHLVTVFRNESDNAYDIDARLVIEGPRGRETEVATETLSVRPNSTHRWIVGVGAIVLDGEGLYNFRVEHEDEGAWQVFSIAELHIAYQIRDDAVKLVAEEVPQDS